MTAPLADPLEVERRRAALRAPGLPLLRMPHPSPTFVCTSPDIPRRIAATLAEAAHLLREREAA